MFTIGGFARLTGVSAKKLRHYDSIGLFEPAFVDPASRYRFYVAAQIPRLRQIAALRDLGLPLATIADVAGGGSAALRSALEDRRRQVLVQQRELARNLAALDIVIDGAGDDVVVRTRPTGLWASLSASIPVDADLAPLFVEAERVVRDQRLRARLAPVAVLHAATTRRSRVEILIPLTGPVDPVGRVTTVRTPSARVATRLVEGAYPPLRTARAWARRWSQATGTALSGPVWVSYLRFAADPDLAVPDEFLTTRPDFVTEILAELA